MTSRFVLIFVLLFSVLVFGEWLAFFRGFNFGGMTPMNWVMLLLVLLGEAFAVGVVTFTIDRALPTFGPRPPAPVRRRSRRR